MKLLKKIINWFISLFQNKEVATYEVIATISATKKSANTTPKHNNRKATQGRSYMQRIGNKIIVHK